MFKSFLLLFLIVISSISALKLADFGAIPDDPTYASVVQNGKSLEAALLAANSTDEDRTVWIESNYTYHMLPSKTIFGLYNVTLKIDGSLVAWEGDIELWPRNVFNNSISLISLNDSYNLKICGKGVVEGVGYRWWWHVIIQGDDYRPFLLEMGNGFNTIIEDLTFSNSPEYHFYLMNMNNLLIQNIKVTVDIDGQRSYLEKAGFLHNNIIPTFPLNTDGIDISGIDIIVRNCTFINFDDAIAVKPIHEGQSTFTNCTQNILIENCYVRYGIGMSMGSLVPFIGTNCIRNVTIRNIEFDTPIKAIYVKSNPGVVGNGIFSHILYEKIKITNALLWAIWIGPQQQHQPHGFSTGCSFFYPFAECPTNPLVTFDDIVLRDVNITGGVFSPGVLLCNETNVCTNFVFDRVNAYHSSIIPYFKGIHCENVHGKVINSNLIPECLEKE